MCTPFMPLLIPLHFEENDDTKDSLSHIFFPPHIFSHPIYCQSMPITLHTIFQKLTAEFACVIWPLLINHHAPSGSLTYIIFIFFGFFWLPCSIWSSRCGSVGSLTHFTRLGIKPAFQNSRDDADPIASQQELADTACRATF